MGLLLALLTLIFFWPQLALGRVLYWGDIGLYFTPMQQFLHENLRQGRLPLWNPLILCGAPYVGNPQTWPFYPLTFLLRWMDGPHYINWTIAVHIWFAAFGTFFFLRRALALGVSPGLLGALVFAFGGQLVSKEQFPNMVQAASYLPWALWLTHQLAVRRRLTDALGLGAVLGLQLLAAHAQMTLLTLYVAGAYGVFQLVSRAKADRAPLPRVCGLTALACAIAFGLAAVQLLPTMELYEYSWRQRLSFRIVDRFYLPLNQIGNFILPTLHGHPMRGDFSARGNFWEPCCFVGWAAFAFALFGAVLAWRCPTARPLHFWTGAFAVGLLLALGGQNWRSAPAVNGLYWVAYHTLPGFRNFHDPARCLLWCGFALAVLAGSGLDALLRASRPLWVRPLALLLPLVCFGELLLFGRTLYPLTAPTALSPLPPLVAALKSDPKFAAHQARFISPDTARVWQRFTGHRSYRQDTPQYQSLWADTLTPNLMMPYGLPDAYGYEPVARRDTQSTAGLAAQNFRPGVNADERAGAATLAGSLGVRYVATLRARPPASTADGLDVVTSAVSLPPLAQTHDSARLYLARNERWQPRARVVTDLVAAPDDRAAEVLMAQALRPGAPFDLTRGVILTGLAPFAPISTSPRAANIISETPDRVVVTAATTGPALLVLADSRHPGWRASVDGRASAILTADTCLRAVVLPGAGAHRVVWTDRPTSVLLGLYLSLVTVAALVASGVATLAKKL